MVEDYILDYCRLIQAKCVEQCSMQTCHDKDIIGYRYYMICKYMVEPSLVGE